MNKVSTDREEGTGKREIYLFGGGVLGESTAQENVVLVKKDPTGAKLQPACGSRQMPSTQGEG